MEFGLDFALAQLALMFLPGIIWANIDAKYGAGLRPSINILLIRAFIFGMTTYSVVYLLYRIFGVTFGISDVANVTDVNLVGFSDEIVFSIPVSLILSILWLWWVKNRCFARFLNAIGASKRFGDEDVWAFTFNSALPHVEYVNVRDISSGFIYTGFVNAYSEDETYRELLLSDAIIYNEKTGDILCEMPHLYISRPRDNMWVEFPYKKGES